jgi:probable HAF family extracellular repeat protein
MLLTLHAYWLKLYRLCVIVSGNVLRLSGVEAHMKPIWTSIFAGALLASVAAAQSRRYDIIDLGLVGASPGQPFVIANNGLIAGTVTVSDGTEHATLWYRGWKADFGKPGLGGANNVAFAVNDRGQAAGEAETTTADPNKEDFCGFKALGLPSIGNTCLPFIWQYGVITPLPTLGGANGVANNLNNRGEVAGAAESTTFDKSCPAPQLFQFRAVLWKDGIPLEFPTVGGDLDGIAYGINDKGQAVGATGGCGAFNPVDLNYLAPVHAVLWENGSATDLKSLGGAVGNVALNINNQGHAVGQSDLEGDQTFDAFLWTRETGMQDLKTLPGDAVSVGLAINDSDEVTGVSLDAKFDPRAFHWQNGTMSDLNSLVRNNPAGLYLLFACSINARGEIIGVGVDSSGNSHGYLAAPRSPEDDGETVRPTGKIELPENIRASIRQQLHFDRQVRLAEKE